jgi:hypothetical protein
MLRTGRDSVSHPRPLPKGRGVCTGPSDEKEKKKNSGKSSLSFFSFFVSGDCEENTYYLSSHIT